MFVPLAASAEHACWVFFDKPPAQKPRAVYLNALAGQAGGGGEWAVLVVWVWQRVLFNRH